MTVFLLLLFAFSVRGRMTWTDRVGANQVSVGQGCFVALLGGPPAPFQRRGGWSVRLNRPKLVWEYSWEHVNPRGTWVAFPLLFPAGVLAIPTFLAWSADAQARRLARRASLNHCPTCNYSLRGLPAASPCPECGAAPTQPSEEVGLELPRRGAPAPAQGNALGTKMPASLSPERAPHTHHAPISCER